MVFADTYEHTIDAKHRLAIPSEVRAQIQREEAAPGSIASGNGGGDSSAGSGASTSGGSGGGGPISLYVTLGEGQALCLYTRSRWEQRANELDASEWEPEQLLEYERLLYSLSSRAELDPQGRIRLPENLLKMSGLGTDVVLIGVKDHLEVRDRKTWQEYVRKQLADHPQILMNPRRAMRKPPAPGS